MKILKKGTKETKSRRFIAFQYQRYAVMLMIMVFLCASVHAEENPTLYRFLTIENVNYYNFAHLIRVHDVNRDGIADMIMHHGIADGFLIRFGNEDFNVFISPENQIYLKKGGLQNNNPPIVTFSYDLDRDGISDFTHLFDREFGYRSDLLSKSDIIYYSLTVDEWFYEDIDGNEQRYTNDHSLKFPLSTNARYDLNGDGVDDVILVIDRCRCTVPPYPCLTLPTTYIYWGKSDFNTAHYDARIDSTQGLVMGQTSYIGDIDGDGIDDLVLSITDEMPCSNQDITKFRIFWGGTDFPNNWTDFTFPDGLSHWVDPNNEYTNLRDLNHNGKSDLVTPIGIISSDNDRNMIFSRPEIFDKYFDSIRWMRWNEDSYYEAIPYVPYNVYEYINIYWGERSSDYTLYTRVLDINTQIFLFKRPYEILPNFFNKTSDLLGGYGHDYGTGTDIFYLMSPQYFTEEQTIVSETEIVIPDIGFNISAYPVPFVDNLNIRVDSKETASVDIAIFNIRGQKIQEIKSDSQKLSWDGRDFNGATVSSGIYFLRAIQGNQQTTTRVVKIK